jgi:hypothetical protein
MVVAMAKIVPTFSDEFCPLLVLSSTYNNIRRLTSFIPDSELLGACRSDSSDERYVSSISLEDIILY